MRDGWGAPVASRAAERGEGRERRSEKERGRDDGPVSRQVASSHGAPIHHRGYIHTARMRISTDTRASRDENVDYAAFLLLSLSLFLIHRLLSFLLPFFRASLPSLALPSSIVGPRISSPPPSLSRFRGNLGPRIFSVYNRGGPRARRTLFIKTCITNWEE